MTNQDKLNVTVEKEYVIDTSVTPLRSFEELKPEEKEMVLKLKEGLKEVDAVTLMDFSFATSSTISRDTEEFLRTTKLNDLQEFNETMVELSNKLKSVDTKKLSEVKENPFEKWPIIGNMMKTSIGKKVNEIAIKQQSVTKVVDSTESILEQIRLSLTEDLIRCNSMQEKNIEYAKALEFECIALQMRKNELEVERERFMNSSEYNMNNLDDVEHAGKLYDSIQGISRKIDNTARFRVLVIQDLPSLKITKNVDIALINSIEDAIINLIPQWKKAFAKAMLSYRIYNAATVMETVNKASQEIFEQSASITAAAVIKSAEMIETPQVASETLRKISDTLISMCDEVVNISERAQEMREKDLPELKKMEREALAIEASRAHKSN